MLSKSEEQIMEFLWQKGNLYLKEILEQFPEPQPAITTVATLLKRMQEKGFVSYELHGNTRQYKPLISKESYFSKQVGSLIKNFFDNSPLKFASFFTTNSNLSIEELENLKKLIDEQIKNK